MNTHYVRIHRLLLIYFSFSSDILFEVIKLCQKEHEYKNKLLNIHEN
jgi:hypothetical protein